MPLLATFLGTCLTSYVGFFAAWFSKQVAIRLALLTLVVSLTAWLWAGVSGILGGLAMAMPDGLVAPASWLWPTNANACIAAYLAARILIWAYHMDLWAMKLRAV